MKKSLNIILAFLLCFTMLATNARLEVKAEGHEHILANMPFDDGIGDNVEWIAWTSNNSLPSTTSLSDRSYYNKYYYLTGDVYLTSRQTIDRSVTIDFNGYSIYKDSNATFVDSALNVSGKWANPLIITNSKATVDENGYLTSTAGFKNFNATNTSGAVIAASGDAAKNEYPNVKIYGVNFEGNSNIRTANDEWMPGAIFWNSKQTLTVDTCNFNNNISGSALDDTSTYGAGGAITIKSPGTVNINKTVFDGNKAGQRGSAIIIPAGVAGVLNINNSKFVNNKIVSSSGAGGTLMLNAGTTTINNTSFDGNINKGNNGTAITAQGSAVVSLNDVSMTNNVNQLNSTYKAALVVIDNANVSVSGNTIITGNTCPDNKEHNVFLRSSGSVFPSLHITSLGANSDISVSTLPVPTSNSPYVVVSGSDQSAYIKAENSSYEVMYDGTNTVLVPEISYTVTLNTNGGTINSGDVTSYTRSTGATLPTDLYYRHHAFAGWYDNAELEGDSVTEISAGETGNKVYYAKWVEAHTHDGCGDGIDGVEWIPWTSNNSLPTVSNDIYNKYYYLTCDVYLTSKQKIYRTVTICLNGYSIYEADNSSNTGALIEASGKWVNPLTITNCKATFDEDGYLTSTAGIYNSHATGTEGAVIVATGSAGEYPNVKLFGIKIANNSTIRDANDEWMPGAIFWRSQNALTIDSCVFEGNISGNASDDTSTYGAGGAITIKEPSTVNITNTLFDGNIAGTRGGAILIPAGVNATLNITDSKFVNNRILSSQGTGGVISLSGGSANISNTIFEDNDNGGNHGTAISLMNNTTSSSLTDVTITNNTNSCERTAYKAAVVAIDGASITVGGKTIITGNTNSAGKEANLFLRGASKDTLLYTNSLSAGSQIGVGTYTAVDSSNPVVVVANKDETAYLTSDDHYLVKYVDGNTVLTTPTEIEDAQANLVLSDNIDAEIDFTLEGNVEDYTVSYSFLGQIYDVELTGKDVAVKIDDIFAFQMSDPINIDVYYKNNLVDTISYSVKSYCKYQIENSSDENLVKLCKATLNYGAAAQSYFNGRSYNGGSYQINMENLANADVETTLIDVEKPTNENTSVGDLGGKVTDVKYTLVVGSDVSMKFYIYTNEDLDLANVQIGCTPAKAVTELTKESTGRYSVKVEGIKAAELGTDFTVTITEGGNTMTITYSPYAFAASKWDANNSLADLCKKLVTYGEAARTY